MRSSVAAKRAARNERRRKASIATSCPSYLLLTTNCRDSRAFAECLPFSSSDRRISATRWPTKELVTDRSQGVQLATMRELARYWATDYDLRRVELQLNALPQFTTEIDGLKIHFIPLTTHFTAVSP